MEAQREMTLDEWCAKLVPSHLANRQLAELRATLAARDQELGECFVLAGGDTDGGDPARCAHRAVEVVRDLRECYEERGRELAATEQALAEARRDGVCVWTEGHDGEAWDTGCGEVWQFTHDGPAENGVRFCHSCGCKVEVAAIEREQEKG